jgi:hypothetical protein
VCQGSRIVLELLIIFVQDACFNKAALFRLISIVVVLASGFAGRECHGPGTTDKDMVVIGAGGAWLYVGKTLMERDVGDRIMKETSFTFPTDV